MNFAQYGTHITVPGVWHHYKETCPYKMFKESLPHVVFFGLGGVDPVLKEYTEVGYINACLSFIKEIESMPTKPIIYLA